MKVNAIGKQNIYLSNYKVNTKQVTFGHYLDDEKYYKEQRLSNLYSEISDVNSRIWDDNYDFDSETASLNDEIASAESDLEASEERVAKLERRVDSKQDFIQDLESESYYLQNQAEVNNREIKQLENKKLDTISKIKQSNEELQKILAEEFKTTSENLRSQYDNAVKLATNGVKSTLIRKVINPILESVEGKESNIPSSIYIEDKAGGPEPFFSWLVKQTDSNYARLNAENLSDKKQATSLLKKISLLASRSYEETGKRTFTLLEGIENSISSVLDNEDLKSLLTNSEKLYHNIIILVPKLPSLDIMKNNKFDIDVKVEKPFLTDKKLGRNSLVEFVSKHQYTGENLLSKIIKK